MQLLLLKFYQSFRHHLNQYFGPMSENSIRKINFNTENVGEIDPALSDSIRLLSLLVDPN